MIRGDMYFERLQSPVQNRTGQSRIARVCPEPSAFAGIAGRVLRHQFVQLDSRLRPQPM
jgi:hypothetical protein